uniref:Alpha-1,3-glucosyltransferase n=1 Tax=Corethrella appendiculata TaxID=1370023 RepID=U5EYC0_9DIPT
MWNKIFIISIALCLRSIISLHSYSGENTPPMFGDFEAQRHWQEITVNLPIKDWYENTTDNDLLYWGLDYPPLTAYHSFVVGKVAQRLNQSYVELHKSRGISEISHKNFMRNTVLIADALIYIPALLIATQTILEKFKQKNQINENFIALLVCMYPGQILIDNGHFQYNNISLGFTAFAVLLLLKGSNIFGAIFFVLALNYKQMELYHALPFFFYLLADCLKSKYQIYKLFKLGSVVLFVFIVLWLPWIMSIESLKQVIHRIFPIGRGVFEDKVSNVWCILNIFIKIKETFTNESMAKVCLLFTFISVLPSSFHLFFKNTKRNFILALINSSLGFFLFSFQVHEKSILLVSLPVLLWFSQDMFACFWFLQITSFSMFPLLHKDGLLIAYVVTNLVFLLCIKFINVPKMTAKTIILDIFNMNYLMGTSKRREDILIRNFMLYIYYFSLIGQVAILGNFLFATPPPNLPHLYPLLISAYSCVHFILFFVYFNLIQFMPNVTNVLSSKLAPYCSKENIKLK